ncbi:hypothetical protein Vafri_15552 [Volvox africanus]|uniref:Uncharacterized protein n=1 Tax=Volvox africanus TaxID=51714 RepID=A0A8J4BI32_9CHLO|nr:hypothetical protein Vafri_15552 [Volvox africanus]
MKLMTAASTTDSSQTRCLLTYGAAGLTAAGRDVGDATVGAGSHAGPSTAPPRAGLQDGGEGTKMDTGVVVGSYTGAGTCRDEVGDVMQSADTFRLSVSMDAVTKLSHYTSCDQASSHLQPHITKFFGPVDKKVESLHAAGCLNLRHTLNGHNGLEASSKTAEEVLACRSSLHCVRSDASALGSIVDIHGVCGAVCMHTVPLRGLFCDLRTSEQFSYYLHMLEYLIRQRHDLQDVYIDFGCRIRSTWERFVAQHPDLPDEAASLRILVNWMHGAGHDLACQLQNSGRYTDEAGWRVGEEIEQLWSMGKPLGPLVRYIGTSA